MWLKVIVQLVVLEEARESVGIHGLVRRLIELGFDNES